MNKSPWVSFCGWFFVGLIIFLVGTLAIDYRYRPGPYPIPAALQALALLGCFPSFGLWALGTVVHRFRMGAARMHAHALVEAQQKAGLGPLAQVLPGGKRAAVPAQVNGCEVCHQAAGLVRCLSHGTLLCSGCWDAHHRTMHQAPGLAVSGGAS